MLRITAQTSAAQARSYYTSADYYSQGQELAGIWCGKGAGRLGLSGTVQQKDWDALCENLNPKTGQQLTARQNVGRRIGWDFSFSVPKSVSLTYAMTQDQRILDAFASAVDQTMADIESDMKTRIRRDGNDTDRVTGNAVWGRYIHFTSRPVNGIPDPQLHAHNFLFNSTFDGQEQRWKAAQIGAIKRDANYYNAIMQSRLAIRLTELGLPVERTAKDWRIGGIAPATEAKFSRRSRQIDAEAERRGITDPDEKARLGALTREGKNKQLSSEELQATWRSWLSDKESAVIDHLQCALGTSSTSVASPSSARQAIDHAIEHHLERESVVCERRLLTTALNQSIGQATSEQVHQALENAPVIRAARDDRQMITTATVLEEERRMIQFARDGRNSAEPLIVGNPVHAPHGFNSGQRQALAHLCSSTDKVMMLRGVAGAGKTTLLSELKKQVEATGRRIVAFAPSSDASRGVLREAGFTEADTVAMLLKNPKVQEQIQDQVLLIDEAGQLGTLAMAGVFDLAAKHNTRVILSGDRYQHRSVERGAALRLLETEAGLRSAALTEIVRQKERYKQAVAYLSQGRVDSGFRTLDDLKWIHEIDDPKTRYERLAAEYVQATEAGKSVLIVSPTHRESARVTEAVRSALRHEGMIGSDTTSSLQLINQNLTLAERQDRVNYNDGDVVMFNQNAPGFAKGTRLKVGTDTIPMHLANRFAVYRSETISLASGDLIRITANGRTVDGHRINNGQVYSIRSIASDGTLQLSNGWHLGRSFGQLDYGYCGTSHASQGKTRDRVLIAESTESFPAASREQFYVSVSRGRSHCSIYTDDKRGLLEAIQGGNDSISATELANSIKVREQLRRMRIEPAFMSPQPIQQRESVVYDR